MDISIGIIGAGNMGGAIFKILYQTYGGQKLWICDRHVEKMESLKLQLNEALNHTSDVNHMLERVDIVIIAVKPQDFDSLCAQITVDCKRQLWISIMSGGWMKDIQAKVNCKRLVRAMSNLPVQVQKAFTGWIANPHVLGTEKGIVRTIFQTMGKELEVPDEHRLNAITAFSASGSAYFFHLCELIATKAEEFGFSKEEAELIAEQTFIGAGYLQETSNRTAGAWRKAVSSRGGTTEAALAYLETHDWASIFKQALEAAKTRAEELSS